MKSRDELLAQLEAEQAMGDPDWGATDDMVRTVLTLVALAVHDVNRTRRKAA